MHGVNAYTLCSTLIYALPCLAWPGFKSSSSLYASDMRARGEEGVARGGVMVSRFSGNANNGVV